VYRWSFSILSVKMCNDQLTFSISMMRVFSVLYWSLQECRMICIVIIGIYECK